ncbi:MAG: response regulator transcription factor [Elusimicrobiales bacterium]|jgi:DNA-binding response OmpR family regulator
MAKKVLLIDDDRQMLEVMRRYLENLGFTVVFTDNGSEALMLARESRPDVIVTDVDMPGLTGLELCKAVKNDKAAPIPVIIISGSKTGEDEIVSGYDMGADDYLIKPFSFPVLAAKINAVMRRYTACGKNNSAGINKLGLMIDPAARSARLENKTVNLTRKEFDLLTLLLEKRGRVLSVPYMLETVWSYDPASYNDPHTVEVHISSLRKKLGRKIAAHIVSVTGHGYKFE